MRVGDKIKMISIHGSYDYDAIILAPAHGVNNNRAFIVRYVRVGSDVSEAAGSYYIIGQDKANAFNSYYAEEFDTKRYKNVYSNGLVDYDFANITTALARTKNAGTGVKVVVRITAELVNGTPTRISYVTL